MALVLLEGFDHYNIGFSDDQKGYKGWNGGTAFTGDGRLPYGSQSHCVSVIINNGISKFLPGTYGELYFGCGFKVSQLADRPTVGLGGGSLGLSGGKLAIYDSTGNAVSVGTNILTENVWYYAEGHFTSTHADARLNGLAEIAPVAGSFTGGFNSINIEYQVLGANSVSVDDMYVCDTTGGINDGYLGDLVVETLYPVSDGAHQDWTVDIGGLHYPRVAEHTIDDDASYNHTTTAGAKDTYGIGDPVLANTPVYGVQLNCGVRKNDAGTRTVEPIVRQGGTDYFGPLTALTAGYTFHSWLQDRDPTGAAWLYSTVNGDEYGIEMVS